MNTSDELKALRSEVESLKLIVAMMMSINPEFTKLLIEVVEKPDSRFGENVVQFGTSYGKEMRTESHKLTVELAKQALDSVVLKDD